MKLRCVACQQKSDERQPYYCLQCFIPIPPYKQGKYIGPAQKLCPECDQRIVNPNRCNNCGFEPTLSEPPRAPELSEAMKIREKNRAKLAQDVLSDNRMTEQIIEMLGLGHLPSEQQGVALSSLAREKINFLSLDYNFTEAHTLADMGHAITEEKGEAWAMQISGMRLATIFTRKGMVMKAAEMLHHLYQKAPEETQIEQLRKLELLARLSLAHRFAGNTSIAKTAANQTHEKLLSIFQEMEPTIEEMRNNPNRKSHYMGIDEQGAEYPRVDYIFTITKILTEEVIARGGEGQQRVSDLVIDRLLELDNLVKILAEISPNDDPTYFTSQLRDYTRLMNGMLWYGDLLIPNSGVRRRLLIEKYYHRIRQWNKLIPSNYWLSLRPARFFEIFIRAEEWSDEISGEDLMQSIIDAAKSQHKPSWTYVIADTYAKLQQIDKAVKYLKIILDEKEEYMRYADDELKNIAQQLYNSIQLESIGLLLGTDPPQNLFELPVEVKLDDKTLLFEKPPAGPTIAVFGDRLFQLFEISSSITSVNSQKYDDDTWNSYPTTTRKVKGHRADVVVVRTELENQELNMYFEARVQDIEENEKMTIFHPPDLLFFQGIASEESISHQDVTNIIISLLSEPEITKSTTKIFTLKRSTT